MAQHGGIQLDGGIGRASSVVIEPMRVADVVLRDHEEFPGLKVFTCDRLKASITLATCASNHVNGERYIACKGCDVGAHHVAQQSVKPIATSGISSTTRLPGRVAPHCIRCGKSGTHDARSIGRVRFVAGGTLDVSCFNRGTEVARGFNSKLAKPRLWAGLKPATITYHAADGEVRTEDIGLRSSRHECERWLAHVHPGAELIKCVIDGVSVPPFAGEHPLYHGREVPDLVGPRKPDHFYPDARAAKRKIAYSKPTKLKLAAEAMDAEGDEFGYRAPAPVMPKAKTDRPSQSRVGRPRKIAAEETLADFGFGSADELPYFIQWLTTGWPPFAYRAPVKAVAPTIASVPVSPRGRGRKQIDLTGHRFDKLTVMTHVGSNERGHSLWRCACDCGNTVVTRSDLLKCGNSKSCGCSRRTPAKPSETADFGFGEEDWGTPLHKIAKAVTAESDHSAADGNGCARRNGWLPPLSEEEDREYRRSFDDDAVEPMEPVADAEALPVVAEAVIAPVAQPEPAREPQPEEWEVRPLSRKERRSYAKAEKRLVKKAQREARASAGQPPSIASTCRAVIAVGHALHAARK